MKSSKVPYKFRPLPAELPPAWRKLSFHHSSVMIRLWSISENGTLNSSIDLLVRDLDLPSKSDRAAVQSAVNKLVKAGFITQDEDGVQLHFEPQVFAETLRCVDQPPELSKRIAKSTQPKCAESGPVVSLDQRERSEERRAPARDRTRPDVHAREPAHARTRLTGKGGGERSSATPVPSSPAPISAMPHWPELDSPPRSTDAQRVHELFARGQGRTPAQVPPDLESARLVAAAAREESGSDDKLFESVVERMVRDHQKDPKSIKCRLSNLVLYLARYTKPVLKPSLPTLPAPEPEPEMEITQEEHEKTKADLLALFPRIAMRQKADEVRARWAAEAAQHA